MPGGSREDQGGYHQQYNNGGGYPQQQQYQQQQQDYYGGDRGYNSNRGGGGDRGYNGGGRQDRYDPGSSSSSRYDNRPQMQENGLHRIEDTIYITNLPQDVTEEKLAEHFGSIGIIKTDKKLRKPKIWIYVDKTTNLPKGDATLTYDDPPSADAAIEWFGGKEFMGNIIKVSKAERKLNIPPERGSGGYGGRGGGRGGGGGGGFRDRGDRQQGGGGNREPREGDWTCDGCGANNFSRRDECFKCHAQKPAGAGGSSSSSSRGGRSDRGGYRDSRDSRDSRGGSSRYDDRSSSNRDYGRSSSGRNDDYRKDNNRSERRDRPY